MPTPPTRARVPRSLASAVVLAILALIAAAAAACEQREDENALANGLMVLSGDVGEMRLRVHEGGRGGGRALGLPDPTAIWIGAGRTNVLVATLVDGRSFVSNPLGDDDPEWRAVEAVTTAGTPPEPPLYFGTWDPPGGAYAHLASDFSTAGLRIVVVDPALEGASEATIDDTTALPVPPAWIDDDRVVVVTGSREDPGSIIVDTASGDTEPGPGGTVLVATSADAATAAVWPGGDEPVAVVPTGEWLDGATGAIRIDPPESGWTPGTLALDGAGRRLAIVWTDGDGATAAVVYASEREWSRVFTIDLEGAQAASVAWLR